MCRGRLTVRTSDSNQRKMAGRISVKFCGGKTNAGSGFIDDDLGNVFGNTSDLPLNK